MKKWFIIFLFIPFLSIGQYKYGLKVTNYKEYRESLKQQPQKELINLKDFIPNLVLDIRYATTHNFVGEKIYNLSRAYARKPVAESLKKAQIEFNKLGYGVKMYDAYRPYSATVKFYEVSHDTTYVASPYKGSRHNRGCALDMTLIDLKTGQELKMPTPYDTFSKDAWPSTPMTDPEIKKNRELLISIMQKNGFKVNGSEWWHFDFMGWNKFEVMDINFEELE